MSEPVATPRQGPSGLARILGIVVAVVGGLAWLLPVFTFVFIVPKFAEIFVKFDVQGGLPVATQALLAMSSALARYWYLFAALWVAVVAGLAIASVVAGTHWPVWLSAGFAGVSLVLVFVIQALIVIGLFLPLTHLIESVRRA